MFKTRKQAHADGDKTYTEERGCINGHRPAKRYVSTGGCIECLKRFRSIPAQRVIVPPDQLSVFKTLCADMGWTVLDGDAKHIPSVQNDPRPVSPADHPMAHLRHLIPADSPSPQYREPPLASPSLAPSPQGVATQRVRVNFKTGLVEPDDQP